MVDVDEVVQMWNRSGNRTPNDRLGLYAQALTANRPVGPYRALDDDQEDRAILALWRVDRPHATIADVHQAPPLALSTYRQLLHDLARGGFGPLGPRASLLGSLR
ncbi:hypothetical protein [Sinomonas mesophila]|uniref:hypothetical protein n=1 Tax=Sinomonas mesophila TaxID=1531955 RepID=UPI000985C899|nr:hypothetical protein [Sinomonas mesophila]